jgi:glycosyltransferase involved in cell wall biosynthesis
MNILLINHYAGSPAHGMEYRPFYLAREWVRSGHNVTIVAASHSHVRTVSPKIHRDVTEEFIDGIRYVWLATSPYKGNGPGRVRNIFSFLLRLNRRWPQIVAGTPPHVVIASSTYPLDIYPARRIAREFGARFVFEVHDLWPLSPIEIGGMSPRHPFIRLLQKAEDAAYRDADSVVSLLPKTLDHMVSHGLDPRKWRWVPNGVAPSEWEAELPVLPNEQAAKIGEARQRGAFLVGYAGGHNLSNGLDTLIDAATSLLNQNIEILLVGQGTEKDRLAKQANGANIHFLPPIPKSAIPAFLSAMDALYIGFRDERLYRFGVCPNKLMDYMMAARPIIYAINGHDNTVDTAGCGITVPSEDSRSLADAILMLSQTQADERQAMGCKGRQYVIEHHDYAVLARKFVEAVE